MTVEFLITPEGDILLANGTAEENALLQTVLSDLVDQNELAAFLNSNKSDKLFGDNFLCG